MDGLKAVAQTTDWAVVFATVVGPILAVWASEWRAERRQDRKLREEVFFALMATRAHRVAPEHVSAINRIDIAFPAKKHEEVADRWRLYHRHLHDRESIQRGLPGWQEKGNDLFADLMDAMARDLKLPFSMETIRHSGYYPVGSYVEANQTAEFRTAFIQLARSYLAGAQGAPPQQAVPVPEEDLRANFGANPVRNERQ